MGQGSEFEIFLYLWLLNEASFHNILVFTLRERNNKTIKDFVEAHHSLSQLGWIFHFRKECGVDLPHIAS